MSRLLLDTHVFLWWRTNDERIPQSVAVEIAKADLVFVSAASVWEAEIKCALGRLVLPSSFEDGVSDSQFDKLLINFAHAVEAARLPPYHADPFDRMLISQARLEGLTLVTHDSRMRPYEASFLWV